MRTASAATLAGQVRSQQQLVGWHTIHVDMDMVNQTDEQEMIRPAWRHQCYAFRLVALRNLPIPTNGTTLCGGSL